MYGIDSYTKLLIRGKGADGSKAIYDSSSTPKVITVSGHTQIDTAQSVFGDGSILFDGTDDYLEIPDSDDFNFGSGAFTIDTWLRFNSLPILNSHRTICGQYANSSNYWLWSLLNSAGVYYFYFLSANGGTYTDYLEEYTPITNVWYHFAVVRSGNSIKGFVDGVSLTSGTFSAVMADLAAVLTIGQYASSSYFNGWLDEFRISKGIARWTSNFTPPTSEYTTYKNRYLDYFGYRGKGNNLGVSKGYPNVRN